MTSICFKLFKGRMHYLGFESFYSMFFRCLKYFVSMALVFAFAVTAYGESSFQFKPKNITIIDKTNTLKEQREKVELKKISGIRKRNIDIKLCLDSVEASFNSSLSVCITGDTCREGLGYSAGTLKIPTNMMKQNFNFVWSTERKEGSSGKCVHVR